MIYIMVFEERKIGWLLNPGDRAQAVMMHDFAITEDYAIIIDVPLVFRPQARFVEA